jgi:tetratricopeptide (TPR) repeat protein
MHRLLVLQLLLVCLACAQEGNDAVAQAVDALQRGDLASAEKTLRSELRTRPNDTAAMDVLGVVLDQEKQFAEADEVYRRAVTLTPRSASLLNNYGNHLLTMGKTEDARKAFVRVVAIAPAHVNANVQLARIALDRKMPSEALHYLQALPAGEVAKDPRLNLAMGVALAGAGKYERAERYLAAAVEASPDNFEALYDLGLAASHAGHDERARDVLQKALALQPENANVMYDLAAVDARMNRKQAALELLARAARIAPDRPDVLFLLAHTAADLGYFADAVKTWDQYLKLRPEDEAARREHAFADTAVGENAESGLADLRAYVRKHPGDAVGHYELAMAEIVTDRAETAKELDRALSLKPDLVSARVTRGLLHYREGKPEAALADFEFAAKRDPENPGVLDRLGEVYLALGRTQDALPVLKKAADLAPRDTTILLRYARALSKAGQTEDASAVFARCRELGPARTAEPHGAGLVDFLGMAPEEQRARYRAGVERTVQRDGSNVEAQVRYLELLLEDGKTDEARTVAQRIAELKPSVALQKEAGRALLAAKQYGAAKDFMTHGGDDGLDLAIANSHLLGPATGLQEMERIPATQRDGDYYLALAAMLEMTGRPAEATAAMQQAMQRHATRADLYRDLAALLIKDHRAPEASRLLEVATSALPDDPELAMMKNSLRTTASN